MEQQSAPKEVIYKFFVDGKPFESTKQIITGADLRQIAGLDPQVRIFLGDQGRGEADRQVLNSASVDLAKPGEEKFYTLARPSLDIA